MPARSAPARVLLAAYRLRGRSGASSSTSRQSSCSPPTGQRCSNTPASRSARVRGSGSTTPCSAQLEPALAVDHHRRCQHQPTAARGEHLGEQHRGRRSRCGCRRTAHRRRPPRRPPPRPGGTPRRRRRSSDATARGVADVDALALPRAASASSPCAAGSIASTATTSWPSSVSAAATRDPMKPAAPVSRTLTAARTAGRHPRAPGSAVHSALLGDLIDGLVHQLLERHQVASRTRRTRPRRAPRPRRRSRVQIGHQSDCRVTHLQFACQHRLRVAGHVHQREALAARTTDSPRASRTAGPGSPPWCRRRPRRAGRSPPPAAIGQYGSANPTWMPPESK